MSNLEERVQHLEREVGDIKTTLVRMEGKLDTFATKTELYQTLNAQTWKIIGLMGVMTALFSAIVKWL